MRRLWRAVHSAAVIPVTRFSIARLRDAQEYMRWCVASVTDADDFTQQFGGTRLQPKLMNDPRVGRAARTGWGP
jgi:hypothetical protein